MYITMYYIYIHTTQKDSLRFKLLAFWRKQTPIIDQKCTHEKVTKNLGRALPPHVEKIQKNSSFFCKNVPQTVATTRSPAMLKKKIRQEIPMMSWSWMVRIVGAKAVNINSGAAMWPVHFGSVAVPALLFVSFLYLLSLFSLYLYTVICSCFFLFTYVLYRYLRCFYLSFLYVCNLQFKRGSLFVLYPYSHYVYIFIETQTQSGQPKGSVNSIIHKTKKLKKT